MDQERRSQREMMQENEKQAKTTYTNAQAKRQCPAVTIRHLSFG